MAENDNGQNYQPNGNSQNLGNQAPINPVNGYQMPNPQYQQNMGQNQGVQPMQSYPASQFQGQYQPQTQENHNYQTPYFNNPQQPNTQYQPVNNLPPQPNQSYPQQVPTNQLQPQSLPQSQIQPTANFNPSDPNYYATSSAFDFGTDPNQAPIPNPQVKNNMMGQMGAKFQNLSQHKAVTGIKKNWWIYLSGLILIVMLFVAVSYFLSGTGSETNYSNVVGKISSDARVPSGSLGNWKINIENRENATLDKVKLYLNFDRTFIFSRSLFQTPEAAQDGYPYGSIYNIGQLKPIGVGGSTALINIEGTLVGDLDTEAVTSGHIEYQVVGSVQKKRVEIEKAITKIGSPELTLDVSAPPQIKNGNEGDIYVDFRNSSDKSLSNLRIKLNYPSNNSFKYISSELQLSKTSDVKRQPDEGDNIWNISELPRFTPQQLKIHGQFLGVPGELKKLDAEIAVKNSQTGDFQVLAKKAVTITITGETLQVQASFDGKDSYKFFSPGETLTMKVDYKNTSTRNLEDVKVLGWIDDPANILDMDTVAYTGGDKGNFNNGKLEWRQQGAPQLRLVPPNSSGSLSFTVKVKEGKGFLNGKSQSQFTLRPRALVNAIATDDVAIVGDEYKALSDLKFNSKIERKVGIQANPNDPNLAQVDYDRLQKGVPASFVVTWTVTNTQNQVNKVKVRTKSVLPANVWDSTSILPITEQDKISYDKVTGDIVWDAGDIPGYTGIVLPAKTISFVMTFTPSEPQVNQGVNIYENVNVDGVDDFTGQFFQLRSGAGQIK